MKPLEKVKGTKILQGHVENKTKEAALAAVLIALTIIGRQYLVIPIFVHPIKGLEPSIVFYSTALMLLSYPYAIVLALAVSLTSTIGILCFPTYATSFTVIYFMFKLVGLKYARYFSFFSSNINGFLWLWIWGPLIVGPALASLKMIFIVPMAIKCSAQGVLALIVVPVIYKALEVMSVIDTSEE